MTAGSGGWGDVFLYSPILSKFFFIYRYIIGAFNFNFKIFVAFILHIFLFYCLPLEVFPDTLIRRSALIPQLFVIISVFICSLANILPE